MNRLLIVACSATKDPRRGTIPAHQRYQGPAYRVLRRHPGPKQRQVLILSARYGFIDSELLIPDYDLKMTHARALELAGDRAGLARLTRALRKSQDTFVFGGEHYRECVRLAAGASEIQFSSGRIGEQLAQLKRWLVQDALAR